VPDRELRQRRESTSPIAEITGAASDCQKFATLAVKISSVTIAPHENPS
jgi:hypothetical protein